MQENKSIKLEGIKDRVLGDEWINWDGKIESYKGIINEGKYIFIGLSLLVLCLVIAGSFLVWYLVSPRLKEFHPILPSVSVYFLSVVNLVLVIGFIMMVIGVGTGKKKGLLFFFLRQAIIFGERFGISRDRIGNSFIKVSNAITRTLIGKSSCDRLLILLPRCLEPETNKAIMQFKERYHCEIFIAGGGDAARQIIKRNRPTAIIAVACERDLVSGIQDVASRIPVIGIPNKRPEGPCKNTFVDVLELEGAIQLCLRNGK